MLFSNALFCAIVTVLPVGMLEQIHRPKCLVRLCHSHMDMLEHMLHASWEEEEAGLMVG